MLLRFVRLNREGGPITPIGADKIQQSEQKQHGDQGDQVDKNII